MAVELAVAYVSLVPSARGIQGQVAQELGPPTQAVAKSAGEKASRSFASSFSTGLKSAGKSIASAGDKMTLAVSAPLAFLAKKATDAASDLNESVNATNVVFGDSGDVIDRWAKKSATAMGLSERAFREAVVPMGSMLQNLGFSQDDAATSSVRLSRRAADMASVFNTDVSEALDAINAGLRGEADPLERFGVGLSDASVQAEALRLGLSKGAVDMVKVQAAQLKVEKAQLAAVKAAKEHGKSSLEARDAQNKLATAQAGLEKSLEGGTTELTAQQKAQARLSLLMRQTEKIEGDFARTSDQTANATRTTAAEAEDAAAAFGQKLLPVKARLIKVASGLIDRFSGLSSGTQDVIAKVGILAIAVGPVLSIFGRLVKGVVSVVETGSKLAGWGAKAASAGAKAGKAFLSTAAEAVKATAKVVAQIALQVARWVWLGVQALAQAAKVALAWVISMGPIAIAVAAVVAAAALIIANWDKIKRFVIAAAKAILDWVRRNWPLIVAGFGGPIGIVVALVVKHWDKIKAVFKAGVDFVTRLWHNAWTGIRDFVSSIVGAIGRIVGGLKDKLVGIFTGASTWLVEAGKDIIRGLWKGVKEIWSDVVDWFKDLPGKVLGALGIHSPPKWAIDAGRWVMRGVTKGLSLGVGSVMDFMSGIAGRFTGPLKDAWSGLSAFLAGDVNIGKNIGAYMDLGERMARAFGWTGGQWAALRQLWAGESGWNPSARNPSSGAFGIPQALPPGKMGPAAQGSNANLATRAAAQIAWGLRYIADRYGSPINALAQWRARRPHWYATGAWRIPETGLAGLHRDEMVLPARIASSVRAALTSGAPAGGGRGPAVTIGTIELRDEVDVDLLTRRLEFSVAGGRI